MSSFAKMPKSAEHQVSTNAWMLTFSDLLTLLLTLFVLRLSMSSLSSDPSIDDRVQVSDGVELVEHHSENLSETGGGVDPGALYAGSIADQLTQVLGAPEEQDGKVISFPSDFTVEGRENGAIVRLGGSTFQPGSDELSFQAATAVSALAKGLADGDARIRVAGHTDDTPINTERFPSNWELSGARAIAVTRQMIDAGVDERSISAVGYAETKPIAGNDSAENRYLNRRVEIFILQNSRE